MAISDAEFIAWLSQDHAERVVLCEMNYAHEEAGIPAEGILYFSDKPYTKNTAFAALPYVECIASVPEFTRSLAGSRLNSYSSSIGAVEIHNNDGELDFLLDLAMDGSYARFFYGDASWEREDFRTMFEVFVVCVRRAPFRRLSIDLRDSSSFLNRSIGGNALVGGVGPYANNARPVNFGFVHNMTPLSYDAVNLIYRHSDHTVGEAVAVEVRDDGVPVSFTDNGNGTFTLASPPVGLITCDVESYPFADTSGPNANVSDAFDEVIQGRGGFDGFGLYAGPHPTFVEGDADDYPLGIHIPEARNIIELLAEITDSGNCFAAIRRDGYFTFGRLKPYDIESFGLDPVDIVEDDIVGSFEVEHLTPEYYRYQAYAHKNWTIQSNLSDLLNADEKARFERKGQYALQSLVGGTTYVLAPEMYHRSLTVSPPVETLLSWEDDSSIIYLTQWMETRRAMSLPWTEFATVTVPLGANPDAPAMFYELELGDVVRVTLDRFGYDSGTLFQVTSININLSRGRVTLRMVRKRGATAPPVGWESSQQYIIQSSLSYRRGLPTIEVGGTSPPAGAAGPGGTIMYGGLGSLSAGGEEPPPEPEDEIYYFDSFSETGVALDAHTPDIGSAYANDLDYPGRSAIACSVPTVGTALAAFHSDDDDTFYAIAPIDPASADYWMDCQFGWDTGPEGFTGQQRLILMSRKTADTFYELELDFGAGTGGPNNSATVTLRRIVSGTSAGTIGVENNVSISDTIGGSPHRLYWHFEGATQNVYIDGVLVLNEDDSGGISSAGDEVGFGLENNGPNAGVTYVDFMACGGHDAGIELQLFSNAGLVLVPTSPGVWTITYPTSGVVDFALHMVNWNPASTYGFGFSEDPVGQLITNITFDGSVPNIPFAYGTVDCDTEHPLGSTLQWNITKDSVPIGTVHLVPE